MPKGVKLTRTQLIFRLEKFYNEEFRSIHGFNRYDYSLITEDNFINSNFKISVICNIHKIKFDITAQKHLAGTNCKICAFEQRSLRVIKYSNEYVDFKLKEQNRNDIERIQNVKVCSEPILWKCLQEKSDGIKCENIWEAKPVDILTGYKIGCPKCNKHGRLTNEIVDRKLKLQGREHLIQRIENVVRSQTPIKWKCKIEKCGHEWQTTPGNVMHNKTGCPHCNLSKGALEVAKILRTLPQYKYGIEYWFDDFKNPKTNEFLFFDFVVYDDRGDIICLIEYQGLFHYESIRMKNRKIISQKEAEKELEDQQYRDNLKRDYCNKNNILLIEIPYWEFDNIEKILKDNLMKGY